MLIFFLLAVKRHFGIALDGKPSAVIDHAAIGLHLTPVALDRLLMHRMLVSS
jgi:hypothetical protein